MADLLKIERGKLIIQIWFAFTLSEKPFALFCSNLLSEYVDFEQLKAYPKKGVLDYFDECCRHKFSSTQTKLYAIAADETIMHWGGFPVGTPLIYMDEVFILDDGQPFVHTLKYFDTKVMRFLLNHRLNKQSLMIGNGK